ncbi:MAG: ATP-binding protein [Bacillota bacterium]
MKDVLAGINHWWGTGAVDSALVPALERDELEDLLASLEQERITALVGPRRVGKSTIIMQAIERLLKRGIDKRRILFIPADDPALDRVNMTAIINEYLAAILFEQPRKLSNQIYVFVDEVQYSADWQMHLKALYDRKHKIKFVVSGSSSTALFHQSKDSLLGRIKNLWILPLNFTQFYRFSQSLRPNDNVAQASSVLHLATELSDVENWYAEIKRKYIEIKSVAPYIHALYSEYLFAGGYPEYFKMASPTQWQITLVEDIIERGLQRDVVELFNIRNPVFLRRIMFFIAGNQGQAMPYSTIAAAVGADKNTVMQYLEYLQIAKLVMIIDNYSRNTGKILRKNKKFYIADTGIRNALLKKKLVDSADEGRLAETALIQNLCNRSLADYSEVYYWRDFDREVDAVVSQGSLLLPIEVKYRNSISRSDVNGLCEFMTMNKLGAGIVVSKDKLEHEENIYYIPAWLW